MKIPSDIARKKGQIFWKSIAANAISSLLFKNMMLHIPGLVDLAKT